MTSTTFKERYYNHTFSFRNEDAKNKTTLSHYIGKLTNKGIRHNITWKVITKKPSYSPSTEKCNLCLAEKKYYITCHPEMSTLNNKNDLAATCPQKRKFLSCNKQPNYAERHYVFHKNHSVCLCVCVCVSVITFVKRWLDSATLNLVRKLPLTLAKKCNIIKMIRRRIRIIWIICIKSHFGR